MDALTAMKAKNVKLEAENSALSERLYRLSIGLPQFATVYCSQCGGEFGPANHGYSHCKDHLKINPVDAVPDIARQL